MREEPYYSARFKSVSFEFIINAVNQSPVSVTGQFMLIAANMLIYLQSLVHKFDKTHTQEARPGSSPPPLNISFKKTLDILPLSTIPSAPEHTASTSNRPALRAGNLANNNR